MEWLVEEGDEISVDQPIVVLETAKVTTEVPSPWSGRVLRLCVQVGESVAVGADLLILETEASSPGGMPTQSHLVGTPRQAPAPPTRSLPPRPETRTAVSPAVRRLARKLGVDLRSVKGTGVNGSVMPEDVEAAAKELGERA